MLGHSPSEVLIPTLATLATLVVGKLVDGFFERRRLERQNSDGVAAEHRKDKKDRMVLLEKKCDDYREKYFDERERRMKAETKNVLLEMKLGQAMTVLDRREPDRPIPPQLTDTVPPPHGSA